MATQSNMGPFSPFNFKGGDKVNGVPVFIDKLPATAGGIAGDDKAFFGRFVHVTADDPNTFKVGLPASGGAVGIGILIADPTIMTSDPAMNNRYFKTRPATAAIFGMIEMQEYAVGTGIDSPIPGAQVFVERSTGMLAFVRAGGTALSSTTYAALPNYTVVPASYGATPSKGYRLWVSPIAGGTATTTAVAAPTISPAAGVQAKPFDVQVTVAEDGAVMTYTIDGSDPSPASDSVPNGGVISNLVAPVTLKVRAFVPGKIASAVTTAAYTKA